MTIFALDTTSEYGSMALRRNGETVREMELRCDAGGYGERIFEAMGRFRDELSLDWGTVDCFAAAAGPGSFTGVRVGLTAIKGLAEAFDKKAVGVSNLRTLASFAKNEARLRAVILDARRSQVYAAVYDEQLRPVSSEIVQTLPDWLAGLEIAAEYEFVSPLALDLEGTPFAGTIVTGVPRALAAAVALCAERDEWLDPAEVDANYVRRSDAEMFWSDRG